MKLILPNDINEARFLSEFWQKKPLLMPGALPEYRSPLTPDELAGLACDEDIESRLVLEKDGSRPWGARTGPFDEQDFASLPESHWTLLVQDVDKHIPEVAELLNPFRFLPDWRLDDIMISYAVDQGSVGPHIDDYDVFLVQARGKRRWMIHTRDVSEEDYIPGLDLRILPEFEAEYDWIMEPGDVLYLPPNVAHWGIAQDDECMTCSVGFRAPTFQEMAVAWCDDLISTQVPKSRFRDGKLGVQTANAEILPDALERMRNELNQFLNTEPSHQERWFGRFITEPKAHLQVMPPDNHTNPDELYTLFKTDGLLERDGWSRMAFIRGHESEDFLYAGGEEYPLEKSHDGFIQWITGNRILKFSDAAPWITSRDCLNLLAVLFNDGHLTRHQERDES